jgi:hypothetical protein
VNRFAADKAAVTVHAVMTSHEYLEDTQSTPTTLTRLAIENSQFDAGDFVLPDRAEFDIVSAAVSTIRLGNCSKQQPER